MMKALFYSFTFVLLNLIPAYAAPTFDAVNVATGSAVTTLSVAVTVGGGCTNRIIIASAAWQSGGIGNVSSMTIGGSAGTFINGVSPGSAGINRRIEMWRRTGVSTGSNTIQFNWDQAVNPIIAATSYCGVHQTTPTGTSAAWDTNGNDNPITINVSSAPDQLVVDALMTASTATTLTKDASQTQRANDSTFVGLFLFGSSDKTGSGTTTMSWTTDNQDYAGIIAVPLLPAPTAATKRRVGPLVFQ